jgi:sortase A
MKVKIEPLHIRGAGWLRVLSNALLGAGSLILIAVAISYVASEIYQRTEEEKFASELRRMKITPTPSGGAVFAVRRSAAFGRLEIPRLDLSVMVIEGVDNKDLHFGVGHIPGTALPGDSGNVGLAGHRDTYFRKLGKIQEDDAIRLTTLSGTYEYRVVLTSIVSPDAVEVLDSTNEPELTLVTCYPFYYVGNAPQRFIVRARQTGLSR